MADVRTVNVDLDHDGARLDAFLTDVVPDQSRSQLQRLIKDGHVRGPVRSNEDGHVRGPVRSNEDGHVRGPVRSSEDGHVRGPVRVTSPGKSLRASTPVHAGQQYVIDLPAPVAATPEAEALPLRILFEDPDVVVLEKPAGMVVHPAAGHSGGTLVNALLHHVKDLSGIGGEARPGIVHRLDRGTSGLMVVAKNDRAHQELSRQFHDREVEKEYVALVWGVVHAGRRIDAPIGRDERERQKMSTRARRARSAVTRVTWSRHFRGVSLLKVAIATGRTHQIRVHLNAIGHPIVGDSVYGGVHRHVAADLRPVLRLERPFLHAARLCFTHPADGRRVEFDSPLPPDLESVIDEIAEIQEGPPDGE